MRRLVTVLLLLCFGMFIPAVGRPLQFCLYDSTILLPGLQSCGETETAGHGTKCCDRCGEGEHQQKETPCCLDAGTLPNGTAPTGSIKIPPPLFVVVEPVEFFLSAGPVFESIKNAVVVSPADSRPNTPSERRAVLGVWRI